ncbi:MAG TPA: DUF5050 domain-containing protein [Lachnospiraceae bacterium]|nr:DUF5050 domain-containing protein [Lachnospiraceae bacterium]
MRKRMKALVLLLVLMMGILPLKGEQVHAASVVYRYTDMEEKDGFVYYIKTDDETWKESIYRIEPATGKTEEIVKCDTMILGFTIYNDKLYYEIYDDNNMIISYTVSLDGKDKTKVCDGKVIYVDGNGIFYTNTVKGETSLYKIDKTDNKKIRIYKNQKYFDYVKNIESTLYFYRYDDETSNVSLLGMESSDSKLATLTSDSLGKDSFGYIQVSDIVEIGGDLYYEYGCYQGTGNFWYGTLKKLSSANKKTTIAKDIVEDTLQYDSKYIYYSFYEDYTNMKKYNTVTGKSSSFNFKQGDKESYAILGAKTYLASTASKKYISVSYFDSGTNRRNLKKDFIKFSYKQGSKLTYSASVKKLGDYFLVYVERIDYDDSNYGWRGRYAGITWYVADSDGKIVGSFK